nr:lytic murein transglycosylase [Chachezhania antarctica]
MSMHSSRPLAEPPTRLSGPRRWLASALVGLGLLAPVTALAQSCGNTGAGFDAWKAQFAQEAQRNGVGARGLQALAATSYSSSTISADRNQKSFKYSLPKFMQVRGAPTIIAQGKQRKAQSQSFYDALERIYGVPAGVIISIHGMETGFGRFTGDTPVVSAIVTLTYDCRRSDFFKPHAIAALKMVDLGMITPNSRGAKHGELGHTQFLPGNALAYGVDADGNGRVDLNNQSDALASTANFLRQKGWRPGQGYQPGQPNFAVIGQWNAATVYQQAIAQIASQIDG